MEDQTKWRVWRDSQALIAWFKKLPVPPLAMRTSEIDDDPQWIEFEFPGKKIRLCVFDVETEDLPLPRPKAPWEGEVGR